MVRYCLCWARWGPAPALQGRLAGGRALAGLGPLCRGIGAAGRGGLGRCSAPGRDHREIDADRQLALRGSPSLAAAEASEGAGPGGGQRRAGWSGRGLGRRSGRDLARCGAGRAARRAAGAGGMLVGAHK